ncbi:MAG: transcription termination/antitermination protein NusA [Clostridia bacterium]|nr:transcription termination/antitermination protein NusA [Clostridia bacterium]
MNQEFMQALTELAEDKNISRESLLETIEFALITAYKKNYDHAQNVAVTIDKETGEIKVYQQKTVVEVVEDGNQEVSLDEAKEINATYSLGDIVNYEVTPKSFGRIAAQTAKQVVVQRIKEAERDKVITMYRDRENSMVTGLITKNEGKAVFVQVGSDTEAVMPANEQIAGEYYTPGSRMKFYVAEVKLVANNPQIILSRTHPALVKKLFEQEVPEIADGVIEIKSISREAGSRSKISVYSQDENVDAVGACVGQRGARVQVICDELNGEKIDIIKYSEDPAEYISAALSPSDVVSCVVSEEEHAASVVVPDGQLSLAIGKEGQNARLAAKLTGWKIDIKAEA